MMRLRPYNLIWLVMVFVSWSYDRCKTLVSQEMNVSFGCKLTRIILFSHLKSLVDPLSFRCIYCFFFEIIAIITWVYDSVNESETRPWWFMWNFVIYIYIYISIYILYCVYYIYGVLCTLVLCFYTFDYACLMLNWLYLIDILKFMH